MSELIGSIHGRFQPFHAGHLAYTLSALSRVDTLYIGITKPEPGQEGQADAAPHRHLPEANPLTYFERSRLIEAALLTEGVDLARFRIIPFPIEKPSLLPLYFPLNGRCYTTLKDEWNRDKIEKLQAEGYDVEVLDDLKDHHDADYESGSNIREMIRQGDNRWRLYLPRGVSHYIDRHPEIITMIKGQ